MNFFGQKIGSGSSGLRRSQSRWRFGTRSAKNFKQRVLDIGQKTLDVIDEEPDDAVSQQGEPQVEFVDNTIKSSKYTLLTFVPK